MLRLSFRALVNFNPKAVLAAIVVSMTLMGAVAWGALTLFDFIDTLDRADHDTQQAAALLEGHAAAVLDGGAAALGRVADQMQDGGIATLPEKALGEALAASSRGALSIVDALGRTVFGSTITLDGGGLDEVLGGAAAADGSIQLLHGQADGGEAIVLARRVTGPTGAVDGGVFLALPVSGLSPVLNVFGDGQHRFAGLFRPDGVRLAGIGTPNLGPLPRLDPGQGTGESDWPIGGQATVIGLKRMQGFPAIAAVALPRDVVLAPWKLRLEHGLAVISASFLALTGLAWLGWASLRREQAVQMALSDANARLEQRVEERTADLRALNQRLVRALTEKERANQAKARFLSAANHDLRQPFQALRLFHHLLMERLKEPRDRSIAEKMGDALDSGEKLLHSLLEVATLDAGVVRPNIADVPMATVLDAVAGEFRAAAADKGLDLRIRSCGALVRTDATLLTRMLSDLVRNAIAYTPMGGVVIGCRSRGQWLRVEVWDTGAGIPTEQLDAIFEDFVQLGNPERDRRRGLGLGLAKVRRKAALLGHSVEVRSRYGQGSVFSVMVPLAASEPKAEPSASPSAGSAADGKGGHLILVVEDDPVQRTGMQLLLESWGHEVLAAVDGDAALAELRSAPRCPDMILTDFRLPGSMTGAQTVTRAADLVGHPIPGIILTGDTAPERIREAVAAGCRLLHKPFTPDVLRDALNAVAADRAMERAGRAPGRAARQSAA